METKWKILYGAGDVAVYNGLKKLFHVYPEEAKIVCDILNDLESEVAELRERLDAPRTDAEGMRQIGEKLIGFAAHDDDCNVNGIGEVRCNCGLTELIHQFRTTQTATEGEQKWIR